MNEIKYKYEKLYGDILRLLKEAYWQGCQDGESGNAASEEGIEAGVGWELTSILMENGLIEGY